MRNIRGNGDRLFVRRREAFRRVKMGSSRSKLSRFRWLQTKKQFDRTNHNPVCYVKSPTAFVGSDPYGKCRVRFFNPADPNGTQGLAATEDQAFFPANAGPGGFAAFQLFPSAVYLTDAESIDGFIFGSYEAVGPVGGFTADQVDYQSFQVSSEPVPEPATLSLLTMASVSLLARRRRGQPRIGGTP